MQQRQLNYANAIKEALVYCLQTDGSTIIIGEGVPDPKGIFGTTQGLQQAFGQHRVFDMPLSENGVTGICIGAALTGLRPIMVHQRIDFALLAMDQLINNAAKWFYMFNEQSAVPLVVRLIIGRGWGQGPQHSQSLQALFSHIPGLKVVMPTTAYDAKGMLIAAVEDNNPVLFIEHRWLYELVDHVPIDDYRVPLNKANIIRHGTDITIATFSFMGIEALVAANTLEKYGINIEIIDMRSTNPIDITPVIESVKKTGRLIVADTGHLAGGICSEVITLVTENAYQYLQCAPVRIATPNYPAATSHLLTIDYYPNAASIAKHILTMMNYEVTTTETIIKALHQSSPKDIPSPNYVGPF